MTARPISVIVCTYNRADLLAGLLRQLRVQDYPTDAFEIVVIDNCSNDHTKQVVERFVTEAGVPVQYVVEGHLGISFVRNRGAQAARYPFLAYIDDDCSVGPDWLSQLAKGFDLQDDVDVVGGRVLLAWDQKQKPAWLGTELEPWLGADNRPGSQPRVLGKEMRVREGNMALTWEAWHSCGGFLGMEQFGSKNMAAGEVIYLLNQVERRRGKVVFVPGAVAHHHVTKQGCPWFLRRAYWQGVSDGILDYLLHRRSGISILGRILFDLIVLFGLFCYAGVSCLKADRAKAVFHLLRAIRRFGLILSETRLVGDWPLAKLWVLGVHLEP